MGEVIMGRIRRMIGLIMVATGISTFINTIITNGAIESHPFSNNAVWIVGILMFIIVLGIVILDDERL
jgi:uncharacterized membrane protein